ncbi:hypothetical protein PT974_11067 [Cladobotryum mycophilum]|uniref:IDI-2 n=1 Tax=Cladobotryum mycophilum TaxID=491253 RepID=A0ABR0SCP3_9HYPO
MKANTIALILAYAASAYAAAVVADAETSCGSLGVMKYDANKLPAGATPDDVRQCADHPLGHNRNQEPASLAPLHAGEMSVAPSGEDILVNRAAASCYRDAPYGCTRGYCWKVCGNNGEWCWTARAGGIGKWFTCNSWKDCDAKQACGKGCPSCGCGC